MADTVIPPGQGVPGKLALHSASVYGKLRTCNTNAFLYVPPVPDAAAVLARSTQALASKASSFPAPNALVVRANKGIRAGDVPAPGRLAWDRRKMNAPYVPLDTFTNPRSLAVFLNPAYPKVAVTSVKLPTRLVAEPPVKPFWPGVKDPFAGKNGEALDAALSAAILDQARTHDHKRDPSMRLELAWVMHLDPFSGNAENVFSWITDGFPGRNPKERVANLVKWAEGYDDGKYLPDALYNSAYFSYRGSDYDRAVTFVDRYLDTVQRNQDRLLTLKALCLAQKNDLPTALALLEKIQHDYPDSPMLPQALFLRGWIYLNDQKTEEARTAFANVVAKYPDDAFGKKARQILDSIRK